MKRFSALLLVLVLLLSSVSALAEAKQVKDFTAVPGDHRIDFTFTAEGHDKVIIEYTNSLENGSLTVKGENGGFSGTLELPKTYPGNNVSITLKSARGKILRKKEMFKTALQDIPVVEKAESGRLSGITICIDPGHQGVAIGLSEPMGPGLKGKHKTTNGQMQGTKTRRYESVVVLEIGQKLRNALLAEGADVFMTREDQETAVPNVRRAEIAAEGHADLFIRLHCNGSRKKEAQGIQVYIPLASTYAKAVADKAEYRSWGEAMLKALKASTGAVKGAVTANNAYVANNWATMPAFLIEMGYMSNDIEDVLLSDPDYQQKLIDGMVSGIVTICEMRQKAE